MDLTAILYLLLIGLLAGVLSGLVGIGGGIVMVPLLILFMGYTQHQAQGTSLAVMLPPVTLLAVLNYYKNGDLTINWKFALLISAAFVIGGFFGSKLAINIDQKTLKKIFGILMLIVSLKMIFSK